MKQYEIHDLPELPMYDIPEELREYGEGACFTIVHEEYGNPNAPLKFLHVFNTPIEKKITNTMEAKKDMVNSPDHYNNYSVEVIEMMERIYGPEKTAIFCELNAFKYRMRMGTKEGNPLEQDLAKEQWYLKQVKRLKHYTK